MPGVCEKKDVMNPGTEGTVDVLVGGWKRSESVAASKAGAYASDQDAQHTASSQCRSLSLLTLAPPKSILGISFANRSDETKDPY